MVSTSPALSRNIQSTACLMAVFTSLSLNDLDDIWIDLCMAVFMVDIIVVSVVVYVLGGDST